MGRRRVLQWHRRARKGSEDACTQKDTAEGGLAIETGWRAVGRRGRKERGGGSREGGGGRGQQGEDGGEEAEIGGGGGEGRRKIGKGDEPGFP